MDPDPCAPSIHSSSCATICSDAVDSVCSKTDTSLGASPVSERPRPTHHPHPPLLTPETHRDVGQRTPAENHQQCPSPQTHQSPPHRVQAHHLPNEPRSHYPTQTPGRDHAHVVTSSWTTRVPSVDVKPHYHDLVADRSQGPTGEVVGLDTGVTHCVLMSAVH